jgi:fibronectin type 3 domain-containing protein
MKKTIIVLLTALTLALAGCDTGNDNNGTSNGGSGIYAKGLWGEWLRMDTGDKWYISNNEIKINNSSTSRTVSLNKQSERVIEVTEGDRKYYLYASRNANASFTGAIASVAGGSRAVGGGMGGARVAIANLGNKANELNAVTNPEGIFTANGIIPGDTYQITPEGGTSVTVTPNGDGDDIGVVAVTSGVNFKTSISPSRSSTDMTEMYINQTYAFNLEFENIGTVDCPAPYYVISAPDGVTINGDLQGVLGTIEPGKKRSVQISVMCFEIAEDHEFKKINVTITDGAGKRWEDSISLRFYKETINFNIKAERPISGVIITPDAKTYSFTNVINKTLAAPRRLSGDYLVVFSGATINTESFYSLGIGVEADDNFGSLLDTSIYEPNDTESTTISVNEQKITAYLYKNDIDYYRISYSNLHFVLTPTNVSTNVTDARVAVSWTAVPDAKSYNIYRSDSQTGTYTKVGTSTSPSYVDIVSAIGTYYYKISAVSAESFESSYSDYTEATVTGPSTPTNVSASAVDTKVTVSWTAVSGASSYNVYRSTSQSGTYDKIGSSMSPSYVDTVTVAGNYYYKVGAVSTGNFEGSHSDFTSVVIAFTMEIDATDLSDTLSWVAANAISYTQYTLLLGKDETIAARTLSYSDKTITITLKGNGEERTVSLSGNGSLFTVGDGVTLVLDDRITLKGHSSNTASLVAVDSGGTLILKDGARISDNIVYYSTIRASAYGGGVYINSNGTFTMSGGEITGNRVHSSYSSSYSAYGGGVYVSNSGMFTMSGGTISSNTAYGYYSAYGGGVVSSGTFMMSGGTIGGNTASYYSYSSSSYSYGGGVYIGGTFTMSGGEISGNTAKYGGGVSGGTFTKQSGGTIYGSNASDSLKNTAYNDSYGHAVYVSSSQIRNRTAGPSVDMDSSKTITEGGGWE